MNQLATRKVFILDDDPFCLEMYEKHLLNFGVNEVRRFEDGQHFINSLIEEPDAVLLDHTMEPFNGLEILKKIKRQNPDLVVIYISAQKDMKTAIDALKYGAFDYIIKDENDLDNLTEVMQRVEEYNNRIQLKTKRSFMGIVASITKMF